MNEQIELLSEIDSLKSKIDTLETELKEFREWSQRMFKLNIENQQTTGERISVISDRLHHHIMNL